MLKNIWYKYIAPFFIIGCIIFTSACACGMGYELYKAVLKHFELMQFIAK